ncbi:O-methyltransferase [Providencia sp.]
MNTTSEFLNKTENMDAAVRVIEKATGYMFQAALRASVKLNIAEYLKDGPKTSNELAKIIGGKPKVIHKTLRILTAHGIFKIQDDLRFALTPEAEFLLADHPYSLRQAVLMLTDETFWMPIHDLDKIILGEPVFKDLFKYPFFEYWKKNVHLSDNFDVGMSSMSRVENQYVVNTYNFPDNIVIVDIAGGLGVLLLEVLKKNPTTKGILFDQPHVLQQTILPLLGDDSRWSTYPGSFFEKCPEADIYLLKYITHDWPEDNVVEILKTIRRAMKPTSKLLLIDCIVADDNKPNIGNEIDLICLSLSPEGGEHTIKEFETLLNNADLKLNKIIDTPCHIHILEALPI